MLMTYAPQCCEGLHMTYNSLAVQQNLVYISGTWVLKKRSYTKTYKSIAAKTSFKKDLNFTLDKNMRTYKRNQTDVPLVTFKSPSLFLKSLTLHLY